MQAAALQRAADLTQRRKVHQTSMVQKPKEASHLDASVAAEILLTTTSVPVTDILSKKIGSQHREHDADNAATPPIPSQPGNLRPPVQPSQPVRRLPPPTPQQTPRALKKNETPYIHKWIP